MSGIDLHTHSTRSDGTTTPSQTVALAREEGLAGIALTDHDTMDGWEEAAAACRRYGLRFVPGLELSTELGGRSIHLLGYFVDPGYPPLVAECDRLRNERLHRAVAVVAKLTTLGLDIDINAVVHRAGGAPVGRPHIAAVMVDAGAVADLDEAFDMYLHDGGPAYVPKHALAPTEGVALISRAGGAAVLAHPGLSTRDAPVDLDLLDELTAAGLAGVEADHVGHDEEVRGYWRSAALERTLWVTGSSDFHGARDEYTIGASTTAVGVVDALAEQSGAQSAARRPVEEAPW